MKEIVTIKVSGAAGAGKTTLLGRIEKLSKELDIDIFDTNIDENEMQVYVNFNKVGE